MNGTRSGPWTWRCALALARLGWLVGSLDRRGKHRKRIKHAQYGRKNAENNSKMDCLKSLVAHAHARAFESGDSLFCLTVRLRSTSALEALQSLRNTRHG